MGAWSLQVSEWNPYLGGAQFSNLTGPRNFTLIGARLGAVRLKAARLKAARLKRLKALMVFPEKLKAVSRGVRKPDLT